METWNIETLRWDEEIKKALYARHSSIFSNDELRALLRGWTEIRKGHDRVAIYYDGAETDWKAAAKLAGLYTKAERAKKRAYNKEMREVNAAIESNDRYMKEHPEDCVGSPWLDPHHAEEWRQRVKEKYGY